jgi:cytosine/adenosine deaminase-related metal-dependent hydrolase
MAISAQFSRRNLLKLGAGGSLLGASIDSAGARPQTFANEPVNELALEPGWLLRWQDGKALLERDKHVLIRHGRIAGVQDTRLPASIPRLEVGDCLLMPGFISGHNHVACGTATRGIVELGRSDLRPLLLVEDLLDDDEIDALTQINLAELILSGCTTQLEMSCTLRQAESYVRVAKSFGARG